MASRRASLSLRLAILAAACGLGMTAAVSGAAAAALAQPSGNNGTVKIDGFPVDDSPANEPHVECPFAVQFFNFDPGQTADISIAAQPPSGSSSQIVAERSDVPTTPDGTSTTFTADDLNLSGLDEQAQQGFHLKLTVTSEGVPGGKKFKVFWVKCAKASPTPTPTKTPTTKAPSPTVTKSPPGVLPVTGTRGIGGLAALGLALVTGGAVLMVIRRRRDNLSISD
jgi:LPXTG-motif cell wall-anchored protein